MHVAASDFVRKYAPWSASKADTAATCPLKFYYTYVKKPAKARPGEDALVGITVHRILELMLGPNAKSGQDAYTEALNESKFPLMTTETDRVWNMLPACSTFVERTARFVEKLGGAIYLLEARMSASFSNKPMKFFNNNALIRGVVDVGLKLTERPHLLVIDHKTGKNRGLEYYTWQFLTYQYMAKVQYPELTHIIPGVHWVQDSYTEMGKAIEVPDVQELQNRVINHLNMCTEKAAADLERACKSPLCNWCDFQTMCSSR